MNDRFRFRVWDKRKNIYIKDFVFNFINKIPYITIEYFDNEYEYTHTFEEDEIIVEQCTGLKDKNGKLIYEGDILNSLYRSDGCKGLYRIVWCEGRLLPEKFGNHQQKQVTVHLTDLKGCEVIGNIHENADLLKGEK